MHVAPLVVVPHSVGPEGWEAAIDTLNGVLADHPHIPLTLRLPGAAIEHLARVKPEQWGELVDQGPVWLAGGWSDPSLADLPSAAQRLQLGREEMAMDAAGITADGLWVAGGWEPAIVSLSRSVGHPLVVVVEDLVDEVAPRPWAVDRAGDTVVATVARRSVPDLALIPDDGLAVVAMNPELLGSVALIRRGSLLNPVQYLESHRPGPPRGIPTSASDRSPGAEHFYRKLLSAVAIQPERGPGVEQLLRLQSSEHLVADPASGFETAHRNLIEARALVDQARHRGDSWVSVETVDWDGDGVGELIVDTAAAWLVIDPVAAVLQVWDDKSGTWPISAVEPVTAGPLARRLDHGGSEPAPSPLRLDHKTEGRSEARLSFVDDAGNGLRVSLSDRDLTIELTLLPTDPIRVGPELPLLLDVGTARLRVDGGEWMGLGTPVAVSGHRFRFTDDTHTMLVSATRPTELFVHPLAGRGLVVWPHWPTTGDTTYGVTFQPS